MFTGAQEPPPAPPGPEELVVESPPLALVELEVEPGSAPPALDEVEVASAPPADEALEATLDEPAPPAPAAVMEMPPEDEAPCELPAGASPDDAPPDVASELAETS